jgi:hypothetical protein
MKQGRSDSKGPSGQKVEPRSRAINPGGVDGLGQAKGNHTVNGDIRNPNFTPIYAGRGYSAPGIGVTTRPTGSQGKYK